MSLSLVETLSRDARRVIIEQSKRAHVGHIGSALSVADLVAALFGDVLRTAGPPESRDRFVLSKGHAALALYSVLRLRDVLTQEQLDSFCGDGSLLGVHPEYQLEGVDFTTGSLGHGLSVGAGCALAARLRKEPRRTFVLLSDAECNEGSVWEAAMFAAHHRLSSLVAIVDLNGQQALGHTKDVLDLAPMDERWRSFGWDVHVIDGHDTTAICGTIAGLDFTTGPPHVLVARTTFGRGVSFMEGQIRWHYMALSDEEYVTAKRELGETS